MNTSLQLQYISQGATPLEHLQNIGNVCEAGCRWVQLRLKHVSILEYVETAKKCREICDQYGAVFMINDSIGVAAESKADGVHLGLEDESPIAARQQLGTNAIIGATANTLEHCLQHHTAGVDYIGLGPFQFTKTKEKLSPILGVAGYKKIMEALSQLGHQIPIIAIGGIEIEDISGIKATGVSGIAVSGLLTHGAEDDLEEQIEMITKNLNTNYTL